MYVWRTKATFCGDSTSMIDGGLGSNHPSFEPALPKLKRERLILMKSTQKFKWLIGIRLAVEGG
jgi:hypothetical protein